ncbi:MAG: ATP-binding protein [Lentilitoribacter sp.]
MTDILYPFIDLAVHAAIRDRFTDGDALAIVSTDFNTIIWTNGPAAKLFNYKTIYDFMDDGFIDSKKTRKKLRETAQQLIANDVIKSANLQILPTKKGNELDLTLELISLPQGEQAILVIVNTDNASARGIFDVDHIISGFDDEETCVAVLGKQGQILGATEQFYALDVSLSERRAMSEDVSTQDDRLIKRRLKTAKGDLPAAIGHLSENPDMYLLFAIDDTTNSEEHDDQEVIDVVVEQEVNTDAADVAHSEDARKEEDLTSDLDHEEEDPIDAFLKHDDHVVEEPDTQEEIKETTLRIVETSNEANDEAQLIENSEEADENEADDFKFDRQQRAVRFVWKTDAAGIFTEISPELGEAVGPNAADILGRRFADVALVFNLNPSEEIVDLIRRRDTWSGKTVMWPVQGTDLSVPVDLAALPTYTRDRLFDGYRGFGIARLQEAAPDPQSIGFALTSGSYDDTLETLETTPKSVIDTHAADDEADVKDNANAGDDNQSDIQEEAPLDLHEDPFRGETPAIDTSDTPKRRSVDKIDQLEELHQEARAELTKEEKDAFLEIRKQLGGIGANSDQSNNYSEQSDFSDADDEITSSFMDPADELSSDDIEPDDDQLDQNDTTEVVDFQHDKTASPERDETATFTDELDLGSKEQPEIDQNVSTHGDIDHDDQDQTIDEVDGHTQNAPALIVYDSENLLFANETFFEATGYEDLEELKELGGIDFLLGDDAYVESASSDDADNEEAGDGEAGNEELAGINHFIKTAEGTSIPVDMKLRSTQWNDEKVLELSFTLLDSAEDVLPTDELDETDEVEEIDDDLEDENERLKLKISDLASILETATDGVVIIDGESKIQSLNASASALFDYNSDDATGKPFAMLFAAESQNSVLDYVNAMSGPGVTSLLNDGREIVGRVSTGGTMPLSMTMGRLSGSDGYCAVLRDISHAKHTEEELQSAKSQAESASSHKTDFLARVSHEIRTPLNAIIGFSDLIAQERFGPVGHPRYNEYAHDISKSGRHVLDIVNDLLDISKIEAGQQDLDFQAVSLNDEITESLSLMQQIANENRVIVRSSLPTNVPSVVADKRSIKQILLNILSNSIRFTPAGGQIVVSSSLEASGNVLLRIRDNGVGMNRSELERAMQPFGQVGHETRQRGDGTGLGLPLTRAMTEANRASFDIVSAPGEGTLVTINFPPQRVLTE